MAAPTPLSAAPNTTNFIVLYVCSEGEDLYIYIIGTSPTRCVFLSNFECDDGECGKEDCSNPKAHGDF